MSAVTPVMSALLACLLAGTTAVALPAAEIQAAEIVASAGNVSVTRDELLDVLIAERKSGDLLRLAGASSEEGVERIARALLDTKLMAEAARARGIAERPEVSRELARSADGALADALVRDVLDALDTDSKAARAFFETHADLFRTAPRRKSRHIVVSDQAEAERILSEVRAGGDFAAIAGAVNRDATRSRNGDLGWVARGVMVKAFDAALFALDKGETSGLIHTSFGWHIIRVEDVDPGTLPPFELIEPKVVEAMQRQATEDLKRSLAAAHGVSINRTALARLFQ